MLLSLIKFLFLTSIALFQVIYIHDTFLNYLSAIVIFGAVMLFMMSMMVPQR